MGYESGVKKLAEMMKKERICTLSTLNDVGQITSRPMTLQQTEFDGDAWLPDGIADPELTLRKVHVDTAEYWDGANKLVQLFGMAKTAVTSEQADIDDNHTIEL